MSETILSLLLNLFLKVKNIKKIPQGVFDMTYSIILHPSQSVLSIVQFDAAVSATCACYIG